MALIISAATVALALKGLSTKFNNVFDINQSDPNYLQLGDICDVMPSVNSIEEHAWLDGIMGKMREFLGDRVINNLSAKALDVRSREFEETFGISRSDLEDDKLGSHAKLTMAMAATARNLPYDLMMEALIGAGTWADGAAFFGDSRVYTDGKVSSTIDNLVAAALSASNFEAAVTLMQSYKNHRGVPMRIKPKYLVVGPSLRKTAFDIVKNDFVAGSSVQVQNANKDLVQLKVCADLIGSYAADWYLTGEAADGTKPLMYQERVKPVFETNFNEATFSESLFFKNQVVYGTRARGEAFLAVPHLIIRGRA